MAAPAATHRHDRCLVPRFTATAPCRSPDSWTAGLTGGGNRAVRPRVDPRVGDEACGAVVDSPVPDGLGAVRACHRVALCGALNVDDGVVRDAADEGGVAVRAGPKVQA